MYRPRPTSVTVLAAALLGLALSTVACSSAPEEPLLRQFFRASQLRDNTTLANFAAATFDPRTDGVVTSFEITNVTEERRQPLMLKELAAAADKVRMADEELGKKMKAYQDGNLEAIERVLKAEASQRPVAARDQAVQKAWRQWRDDAAASAKAVSDARTKLNAELPLVELSAQGLGQTVDVMSVQAEMVSKDVTLTAQVRSPEGTTAEQQLTITLVRGIYSPPGAAEPLAGRWIITRIEKS